MQLVRKEAVAGMFYPDDPSVLSADIKGFLSQKTAASISENIQAAVCPHAGYMFSGHCAASAYHALSGTSFDVAIIIAPSHHSNQFIFSQGSYEHYRTPLGLVKVNQQWIDALEKYPEFSFNAYAHEKEHALEVQLPFLQMVTPTAEIVPILLGKQSRENGERLAVILHEIQKQRHDKILFIISTDLSHYHPRPIAEKMDKTLQSDLESLSADSLSAHFESGAIEACGIGGLFFLLAWSNMLSNPNFTVLQYAHSGQVNHDDSQVVGYLSGLLTGGNN